MKKAIIFTFAVITLTPFVTYAVSMWCPKFSAELLGESQVTGNIYRERLLVYKVSAGEGYEGLWKIDLFEQTNIYPHNIGVAINTTDRHEFGNGVYMTTQCMGGGNTIQCRSFATNMHLEVVNGQIRMQHTTDIHGEVDGDQMSWKFDLNSPFEPTVKGPIEKVTEQKVELSILMPTIKNHIFDDKEPVGELEIQLFAETTPDTYKNQVQWKMPQLEGSSLTFDNGTDGIGHKLKAIYTGLPASNADFGEQKLTALLKVGMCRAEETVDLKFFYSRDVKNNPEGIYPNWYYYYKQTPASKPNGQSINIKYADSAYDCDSPQVAGFFNESIDNNSIFICNLKKNLGAWFKQEVPLIYRFDNSTLIEEKTKTTFYIDSYASLVEHEAHHKEMYYMWRHGKSSTQIAIQDQDADGIPDALEMNMYLDPQQTLSWHNGPGDAFRNIIKYDEEILALEKNYFYSKYQYNLYDWAYPGANYPVPGHNYP
jgi:hypothetical protein